MKKTILGIIIFLVLLTVTGCDKQINYNLTEQIEFLPESGPDQYVMCKSLFKGIQDINFQKYEKKKVYLDVVGGTPYTQNVLENLALEKLHKVQGIILKRLSAEEKNNGLKEEIGDFELNLNILTCGVHSYDGIIRKNIFGLSMISLEEKNRNDVTVCYPGKLQCYQYEKLVFSSYFIVIILTFIMLSLLIILKKVLNRF